MLKVENCTDISVGMLMKLYKEFGVTVDINDSEITGVHFESKNTTEE